MSSTKNPSQDLKIAYKIDLSPSKNPSQNLKIVTWNVNGIRAFSKKSNSVGNFETFIDEHSPDVVCFQEIIY